MKKQGRTASYESWAIANAKNGTIFYTDKEDKHITALSTYYQRPLKTERLLTVTTGGKTPLAKYITKVTIL
jgi:hypothetical protein